ncbi:MAG: hypothetical protein HPY89_02040 [Pelotomaculum sp.]|uniref:Uncharacterized protein n=1 Tax=Pelotomaculum thermopropionicum (strain DSM 13744 / JCM 10971 / SI) TaxID=370438 RepID=A5D0B7_PELTS|nr:hypothetical protein [Pelotomaculum sp.]BAF60306.1 hypothetical protein PTH_2125 [Pelotomaculum thermopropionicum SI]
MRLFNAVLAGLITSLLLCILLSLATLKVTPIALPAGWIIFALLFYRGAASAGKIWARACLAAALECLAMPLASWLLPYFYNQQAVLAAKQGTRAAGQAFGSALGGGLINVLSGYTGLIIGFLLLATAYFSLKPVRRKRKPDLL